MKKRWALLIPILLLALPLVAGEPAVDPAGGPEGGEAGIHETDQGNGTKAEADSKEAGKSGEDLDFDAGDEEFGEDLEFTEDGSFSEFTEDDGGADAPVSYTRVKWSLSILLVTVIAGILVRYPRTRNLRALFMLGGLVILGFYRGGCPCMISSLQNTVLALLGVEVNWQALVWFLGLIPVTYVFGKVWCGWVCHLGAFQEFLFIPKKFELFRSRRAQRVMRYIRYVLLAALLIQLLVTKKILFNIVGPFKVAFNLFSANTTGYVLLALLLISSVFIYRPFCKAVCPVGLILGWISKIPGSSVLGIGDNCKGCPSCAKACRMDAITRENRESVMDNQDCIACGDCLDSCRFNTLSFYRKGKFKDARFVLKSDERGGRADSGRMDV